MAQLICVRYCDRTTRRSSSLALGSVQAEKSAMAPPFQKRGQLFITALMAWSYEYEVLRFLGIDAEYSAQKVSTSSVVVRVKLWGAVSLRVALPSHSRLT